MPAQNRAIGSPSRCRLIFRLMKILSRSLMPMEPIEKCGFFYDGILLRSNIIIFTKFLYTFGLDPFSRHHRRNPANVKLSAPKCKSFGCVTYRPSSRILVCRCVWNEFLAFHPSNEWAETATADKTNLLIRKDIWKIGF